MAIRIIDTLIFIDDAAGSKLRVGGKPATPTGLGQIHAYRH